LKTFENVSELLSDLIDEIIFCCYLVSDEESSTLVVNELLLLKKGPDAALLELEDKARDALLEKVST
jgi:hypothetical protein